MRCQACCLTMLMNSAGGLSPNSSARSAAAKTFNRLASDFLTIGFFPFVAALYQSSNLASSRRSSVVRLSERLEGLRFFGWLLFPAFFPNPKPIVGDAASASLMLVIKFP